MGLVRKILLGIEKTPYTGGFFDLEIGRYGPE